MRKAELETIQYTNLKSEHDAIEASKRDEEERKQAEEKKAAEELEKKRQQEQRKIRTAQSSGKSRMNKR